MPRATMKPRTPARPARRLGLRPHHVDRRGLAVRDPLLAAADAPSGRRRVRAVVARPEMSEPVAGSDSAIAATLMWPFSSSPLSSLRNSCFCSSVPMRATGDAARPEPPSASAMPAQP